MATDLISKFEDAELIVIEETTNDGPKYYIDRASNFSEKGLSETYGNYGQSVEFLHCDDESICPVDEEGERNN